MPDLTWPRHGFHHTVDSALMVLSRLGIGHDRITIRKAGRGWARFRIVEQYPEAGRPLAPDTVVELVVEGDGLFNYLPAGMREGSREGEIGTGQVVSIFDDAVEKAAFFVRQGGLFFDVRPSNPAGCARWIRLFGINPEGRPEGGPEGGPGEGQEAWPKERWYKLAILLPCLRYLSGRESGLRLATRLLLDLEIAAITWRPRWTLMPEADRSLLGLRSGRLGVDLIVGDGVDDEAAMEITLRAESLEVYRSYQTAAGQRRVNQVMRLVMPYHWIYEVKWLVGNLDRAPRLGDELENSVLGVNSHLGVR